MNITDVRIRITKNSEQLRAVANITIDNVFAIHDIKIIESDKGIFVAMPSRKEPDGTYKDICHPLNTETRQQIQETILSKYEEVKSLDD